MAVTSGEGEGEGGRGGREGEIYLFICAVSSPVRIKRATRSQSENIISL